MLYDPSHTVTLSVPHFIHGEVIMEKLSGPWRRMPLAAGFPVITAGMMMVSTIVFVMTPPGTLERFCTVTLDDFSLPNLVLTTLIRPFLHSGFGVFLANMVLLWCLGAALEPGLGRQRILATVILSSVIASLVSLNRQLSAIDMLAAPINVIRCPPDGTSGAIAGLAGLLTLGFGFPRPSVGGSLQGGALFAYGRAIIGPLLVGILIFRGVAGMALPADGWGHAGGFVGGLTLALIYKLQDRDPDGIHSRAICRLRKNGLSTL
jgi:membrane associated rhomboid family serine protease